MGKKDKDSDLDDYEKLKNEIIRDKVSEIFRNHFKGHVAKMEEIGFEYFEDDDDYEEIEERNAKPENQRQRDLVAYFENKKKLSKEIFESYSEEKAAENPNYPLIRKYFKKANKNLKSPNRVRYPTDCMFASGCSPPRFTATQLPSATGRGHLPREDFHLSDRACFQAHGYRLSPGHNCWFCVVVQRSLEGSDATRRIKRRTKADISDRGGLIVSSRACIWPQFLI